ncbi:endolytic transglycosylase MltG [Streptomyces sp. NPDC049597]|uniref:endolytic transglycosylase MltG n=1 Tax=Streptomyces sp. NPDC049597 TaxID=3155276 RepID=UPI003429BDDA
MTEYGRSPGSEPWHPEDPLYGDQGWGGQAAPAGHAPYGGQPQQQYPQAPQYGTQQDAYQQQYGTQQGGYQQQYGTQDPYQQAHDPYQLGAPPGPQGPGGQYDGGWDTGQQTAMPYGADHAGGHGGHPAGYGSAQESENYSTSEAYPPPQPPGRRQREPEPAVDWEHEAAQEETHPFFTGDDGRRDDGRGDVGRRDDGDDGYDAEPRGGGRDRRGKGQKKSRNGLACLVVAAVLVGGLGGVGYVGYQFWQDHFGAPEDYAGAGTGSVQVEIPRGAGGYEIGNILREAGVVKSVDAFVAAQEENPKGKTIQDGVYLLKKQMSAASAVELMLSPASRNNLIIAEGLRNAQIYAAIDKQLELKPGTTEDVAEKQADKLGLPDWATGHEDLKDPLEGFLFPASYPAAKGTKPEAVLKKMVARANQEYEKAGLESKAAELGLKNPWELLTVASLVQEEGKTHDDFRKMSEVVYNRLKPTNTETNQLLQFDSAFNYLKGQSEIDISEDEINSNMDPYNTYTQKGLTPGPISNPGNEAINAALNPTNDGWIYFVATDGMNKTEFAKTYDEFLVLRDKFNAS